MVFWRRLSAMDGADSTAAPKMFHERPCGQPDVGQPKAWPLRSAANYAFHLTLSVQLSWVANWLLLALKILAFAVSRSKAVMASMADSAVDLASQMVLAVAERQMSRHHPSFPVGRSRLEGLAVIACAGIMIVSSLEVVQSAALDLYRSLFEGKLPELDLSALMFAILSTGTAVKLALYLYCNWLKGRSDTVAALAEDHINDVASNLAAIIAAIVTKHWHQGWWVDPVAAIVISVVIVGHWVAITYGQAMKLVGQAAPHSFTQQVEGMAKRHHPRLRLDRTRAYHSGARYNVEMDVLLPAEMTVHEFRDIALDLQDKIEALESVERAFIHVDYETRSLPIHKIERDLLLNHCLDCVSSQQKHQQLPLTAIVIPDG